MTRPAGADEKRTDVGNVRVVIFMVFLSSDLM